MIYLDTTILADIEKASFEDALLSALEELRHFGTTRPTLTGVQLTASSLKASFRLDGEGSPLMCVHVAGLAASVAEWEDVTHIRFIMVPKLNTATFEMKF
ncbi:hypothetical protein [Pseudomonas haemolytica]|jgi:hypothetical protein|uniref:Uncharacterized protein n=1 Tax=Pseudomonas haemolytica TaxID=2600065 RepID=A0ABS1H0H6_9PSED|nr:hypothetical protein [Pseudomonas haemolytica]MBK3462630.1 hypothetical protein [Pseudomonas haemolytica]